MHDDRTSRIKELALSLDPKGYPTGKDNIVWATFDLRQAETIRNALTAQHIGCTVKEKNLQRTALYLLHVGDGKEREEAMDFVWREASGLRLRPDWQYPMGGENESFDKWMNGT